MFINLKIDKHQEIFHLTVQREKGEERDEQKKPNSSKKNVLYFYIK